MDAIEQRLTTDVTSAQAVVDLGKVVRHVDLDRGRPVSLVRIGMVIDALSRYLVDGGAMLYGVAERTLLSEAALTSKERMVLGRWADDGLIEVTASIGDRVLEIADITGLPLITAPEPGATPASPYEEMVERYSWLSDCTGRVLALTPRSGTAVLTPVGAGLGDPDAAAAPAVGRAKIPEQRAADTPAAAAAEAAEAEVAEAEVAEAEVAEAEVAEAETAEVETAEAGETEQATEPDETEQADETGETGETAETVPVPVEVFANRGIAPSARTRISWHRFPRAEPNGAHETLLRRRWRCHEFECPVFGEHRRIGQPVPRLRGGVPICPRHDEPVDDIGPREPAYPVSIVVDDLPRRRLVVRADRPLAVGRGTDSPDGENQDAVIPDVAADEGDLASVAPWLHRAAAAWISPVHVRLEASGDGLIVTDVSDRGTVIWQRKGPDDHGTTRPLRRESYPLGEWDSVELYTGIELMRGDRRLAAVLGRDDLDSVLLDAPTAAHHQVSAG